MWFPLMADKTTALLTLATILFPAALALRLPTSLSTEVSTELDRILQAERIELPDLWKDDDLQTSAKGLITAAQRARVAIASHVIQSPFSSLSSQESVERAAKLQDELSERIQSHVIHHLDQINELHGESEWAIHRGLQAGVAESKGRKFTDRILRPVSPPTADNTLLSRVKSVWEQIDPFAAIRRWRIRRLLRKLSSPTSSNLDRLRARLSAVTAQKSVMAQTAAAAAEDEEAARRIEDAPVIHSNVVLDKIAMEAEEKAQRMAIKKKPRPMSGATAGRFEPQWAKTLNRGPKVDWSNVPIPGMAR